jgi:riboflavin kinase / FMN adenylyltransferase
LRIVRHPACTPPSARGASLALGNFDGVHRGHQALLAHAAAQGATLAVLAFEPHPQEFFRPATEKFRLTPFRMKAQLLAGYGVQTMFAVPFNAKLSAMDAETFVRRVIVEGAGAAHVTIGADFQFGKGRGGNAETLRRLGTQFGFGVHVFETVMADGAHKISSTMIREALKAGDPREASRLLGRRWEVSGHVRKGDQRGRTIGFPTANVALARSLEPALGVYAVTVKALGRAFAGVANFGRRPTFDKTDTLLEVHLFDFEGDLYGRRIDVAFADFIRPEMKFAGLDALKAQIAEDAAQARRVLGL